MCENNNSVWPLCIKFVDLLSIVCGTVTFDFIMKPKLLEYMLNSVIFTHIVPYYIVFLAVQCLTE
jgi:hypothetical protein